MKHKDVLRIGDKMSSNDEGLALTRDRRSNAGARMARLLEAEDEDDFYKTTYGGFNEVWFRFSLLFINLGWS